MFDSGGGGGGSCKGKLDVSHSKWSKSLFNPTPKISMHIFHTDPIHFLRC